MKFEVNVRGQNYEVDAPNENALPEIVETISKEQYFQQTKDVDVAGVRPSNFIGSISRSPSFTEKARMATPSIGQFAGGLTGGYVGSLFGKPAIGGAIGGTIGRSIGDIVSMSSKNLQLEPTFSRRAKQAFLGPVFGGFMNLSPQQKEKLKTSFVQTAATEGIMAPIGAGFSRVVSSLGKNIAGALMGDRVAERGVERGFGRILDPKHYKNRLAKDIAIKANKFFNKLFNVTGRQTQIAMSKEGVGDAIAPISNIKNNIVGLDDVLGKIDDFGVEVSPAQKKILKEMRDEILGLDEGLTIQKLWDFRKKLDKVIYNKRFTGEALDYIKAVRNIIAKPIREASEEVAEAFGRYHFVSEQNDELGKSFSAFTLGDPERGGEIFAPKVEKFASNILKTTTDDQIRLLKKLDSFLPAEDQVIEELLDAAAAEAIDKPIQLLGLPSRIFAGSIGGRKAIAGFGKFIQRPSTQGLKTGIGRGLVVGGRNFLESNY